MASSSSITINFKTSCQNSGDILVVESDAQMNNNKTCFLYGDKYYFKVYPFPIDSVIEVVPSDGIVSPEGTGVDTIPITGVPGIDDQSPEYISFANENTTETSKPITDASGQSDLFRSNCYWLSQGGSVAALKNGVGVRIPQPTPVVSAGNVITVPDPIIASYRAQYPSYFKRFSLTLPNRPYTEYPVVIFIVSAVA